MVEIKSRDTEKFEEIKTIKKKSAAQNYRGWLQGRLQICRNALKENPTEIMRAMEKTFEEMLNKFNEMFPDKIIKVEIIQGWKNYGEAHPEIWKGVDNNFVIKVWHQSGDEIKEVEKEAINRMIYVISKMEIGDTITCYEMACRLGYGETPKTAWKSLWADRMNEYFPHYYQPLLCLKEIGIINYGGRGNITRIK